MLVRPAWIFRPLRTTRVLQRYVFCKVRPIDCPKKIIIRWRGLSFCGAITRLGDAATVPWMVRGLGGTACGGAYVHLAWEVTAFLPRGTVPFLKIC